MIGRFTHIEVSNWPEDDLMAIAQKGFERLAISIPREIIKLIARESIGLPIITQSACLHLIQKKMMNEEQESKKEVLQTADNAMIALHQVTRKDAIISLNDLAVQRYAGFSPVYEKLRQLSSNKRRKYKTYELILFCFFLDPLKFVLSKEEIHERLNSLPINNIHIPSKGAVTKLINIIDEYQEKLPIKLLEWCDNDGKLYMIEPSLLFFLKWNKVYLDIETNNELFHDFLSLA